MTDIAKHLRADGGQSNPCLGNLALVSRKARGAVEEATCRHIDLTFSHLGECDLVVSHGRIASLCRALIQRPGLRMKVQSLTVTAEDFGSSSDDLNRQ